MLDLNVVVRELRKEVADLENAMRSGESVSLALLNIKYTVEFHLEEMGLIKSVEKEEGDLGGDNPFVYVTVGDIKYAFVDTTYKLVWYVCSDSKWTQLANSTLNII